MDVVEEIIRICSATGRDGWERLVRRELGGRSWYFSAATGRAQIAELVRLGVPRRTAYQKIRGR